MEGRSKPTNSRKESGRGMCSSRLAPLLMGETHGSLAVAFPVSLAMWVHVPHAARPSSRLPSTIVSLHVLHEGHSTFSTSAQTHHNTDTPQPALLRHRLSISHTSIAKSTAVSEVFAPVNPQSTAGSSRVPQPTAWYMMVTTPGKASVCLQSELQQLS